MAAPTHIKLIGAEDGQRYALPDVGEEPEYAVPTGAFQIEEIITRRLHRLARTQNGWEKQVDVISGEPVLTGKPVAGCRDCTERIRCYGDFGMIVNEEGMVAVIFGDTPLQEESSSKPCGSIMDIDTPRSDECAQKFERFT